jgi:16S rRNA (guanine527-N7)-methyltransferase
LHLVGPCSADEFVVRHILESLTLLNHLPTGAKFADVGTGAGLPSIPCLVVREDLKTVLIESKHKKARFLENTIEELGLRSRATVANRQFEEVDPAGCSAITCRALDKFTENLPRLIKWAGPRTMLLFGGNRLGEALGKLTVNVTQALLPMSDQRYCFVINPYAPNA